MPPTSRVTPAELALNPMALLKGYSPDDQHNHHQGPRLTKDGRIVEQASHSTAGRESGSGSAEGSGSYSHVEEGETHSLYGSFRMASVEGETRGTPPLGRHGVDADSGGREAMLGRELLEASTPAMLPTRTWSAGTGDGEHLASVDGPTAREALRQEELAERVPPG